MKITYINYKEEFPNLQCRGRWFYVSRYWSGKIINIGILHWAISFDLRKDWIADFLGTKP